MLVLLRGGPKRRAYGEQRQDGCPKNKSFMRNTSHFNYLRVAVAFLPELESEINFIDSENSLSASPPLFAFKFS